MINPDCRDDEICHNNKCIDPCLVENPCAAGAICYGKRHTAQCRCPEGMDGSPYEGCYLVECRVNRDCPQVRKLFSKKTRMPLFFVSLYDLLMDFFLVCPPKTN